MEIEKIQNLIEKVVIECENLIILEKLQEFRDIN